MTTMPEGEQAHLSIGEVLSLLQEEFPDVTISKIRFLESQGLLDPERTPSGYRKFYEPDIARLRWILRQQKDHFLPLRVIKERLDNVPAGSEPQIVDQVTDGAGDDGRAAGVATPTNGEAESRRARRASAARATKPAATKHLLDAGPSAVSLTREELATASGLHEKVLGELERYGLITGRPMGRDTVYDEEALVVAQLAAGFLRFGVEARHLRMYKQSAEREASFFEQVVLPLVKQRNPDARRQAVDNLAELRSLGDDLRAAMLRQALRSYF